MNAGKTELQVKRENFKITWSQFSDYIAELMNQKAVNDYRQKFFFQPTFAYKLCSISSSQNKACAYKNYRQCGQKNKTKLLPIEFKNTSHNSGLYYKNFEC